MSISNLLNLKNGLNRMFQWLRKNKEWFFSGIGVFILSVLYFTFFSNTKPRLPDPPPPETPTINQTEQEENNGKIIFNDNTVVIISKFWNSSGAQGIHFSKDINDMIKFTSYMRKVDISKIKKIDFIEFTQSEKSILIMNRSITSSAGIRKAKITFYDNTNYNNIYLRTSSWEWRGLFESGGISSSSIRSIILPQSLNVNLDN